MDIKLKDSLRNAIVYVIAILLIALLFFGIESLFEDLINNNDTIADLITAAASTFIFLWLRSARDNARLSKMLRLQSEERAHELEIRVAEKTERIRQMYEAQSKFLAEIAHEFQTPISILKGNVDVLARIGGAKIGVAVEQYATERATSLYVATTTLDRLSRLVNNLLDIAKLNFSKEKFRKQIVDVRNLVAETIEDCAILAEDKNISILIAAKNGTVLVAGDKDKLKEVLLNLLSNALKYTSTDGTITIAAEQQGGDVEIVVADTGPGIAPENLPQIFERFYRIENPKNLAYASTGLGLHICRQIVEAHDGTIIVESEPGKGSRFIIHLPLVEAVL